MHMFRQLSLPRRSDVLVWQGFISALQEELVFYVRI